MSDNWYKFIVKKKSDMQAVRNYLAQSSYMQYDLQAIASPHPNIQNLVKRFFTGCIFIHMPEEEIPVLVEKSPVTLQIKKEGRIYKTYTTEEVENLILFLQEFEGIFTLVSTIPQNCEQRQLGLLGHPHRLKGFLYKATGNTNRFYVKLSDTVCLCFPVTKKQEIITERRTVPYEDVMHIRWYVLRTRQEEEWQHLIQKWRKKHLSEIEGKTMEDCTTYIPYTLRTNALGQLVRIPIFRGFLFVKTTLRNLQYIQREQIPGLENGLMKVKNTFLKDLRASKYVIVDEESMTTFMFVNDNYSDLVEYESFDFKEHERVRFFRPGHPLNGQIGTLQHKGKKLYIAFGLTNITGNFRIPAIEVKTIELRKILPQETEDVHS